jgi:hypothetical protein
MECTNDSSLHNDTLLLSTQLADEHVLLRGPKLIRVQVTAERFRTNENVETATILWNEIMAYGTRFVARASCTFSDLCPYLELLLESSCKEEATQALGTWLLEELCRVPNSTDPKQRRSELRVYISAVLMIYKVASYQSEASSIVIPPWTELLHVWKSFQAFDIIQDGDQVRRAECGISLVDYFVRKYLTSFHSYLSPVAERKQTSR